MYAQGSGFTRRCKGLEPLTTDSGASRDRKRGQMLLMIMATLLKLAQRPDLVPPWTGNPSLLLYCFLYQQKEV